MNEQKQESGFLTLEDMRDAIAAQTQQDSKKDTPPSGDKEVSPSEKKGDLSASLKEADTIDLLAEVDQKEKTKEIDSVISNFQRDDSRFLTQEELKAQSKVKLQKFLDEGTREIYSHSKSQRGPSSFQTGTFASLPKITQEDVNSFRQMKFSDTQVNQYRHFRAQREKKAEDFQLQREAITNTRLRPLYAEDPMETEEPTEAEVQLSTTEEEPVQAPEYASANDQEMVGKYLTKLKKTTWVATLALGALAALSVIWLICLDFTPSSLPSILTPNEAPIYLTVWLVLMIAAAVLSWDTIRNGMKGLPSRKVNCNTAVSFAVAGSLLQLVLLYFSGNRMIEDEEVFVMAPITIVCLFVCYLGKYLMAHRTLAQFRLLSETQSHTYAAGMIANEDLAAAFTRGRVHHRPFVGFNRKTEFTTDFMYYAFLDDISDRIGYFVAPISLCLAILFLVISSILTGDFWVGITMFTAVLSIVGFPTLFLALQASLFLANRLLNSEKSGLLGYEAAIEFGELNAAMTTAEKLFPQGSVQLCGMKMFNEHPIDDSIVSAASILHASNSVLRGMFLDILLGREDLLKPVDSVLFEDGLGISGWVADQHVVIGSREMAINHNIAVPTLAEEKKLCPEGMNFIYVSISGELTAAFVFALSPDEKIEQSLIKLLNNDIVLVVQTVDPVITAQKLSELYMIDEELFKILPARFHKAYRKQVAPVKEISSPVINNGDFSSYISSLTAAKRLNKTIFFTTVLSLIGSATGILMLLLFEAIQQLFLLSAFPIFVLQLIVTALVLVVSAIRTTG